ncbi:MAG TPA: MBL fold metallo-hydrolase, partial [Candidatus Micrarchaeota archaeon]|nr:MBL fold metallo-hydrolase [Candidatus Micrarchaeota archaeon]
MDKTQIFLLISVLFIFSIMQGCIIPDMTESGNSPKPPQVAAPEPTPSPEAGAPAAPAAVEKPIMAFISVGMGESTLLLSDNGSILVDAGPDPDAASVIDVLSKYGVKKIDMLVITRPTPGHYAGAPAIIKGFSVPWIVENGASGPDDYNSMIVDATKNRIMVEDAYLGWAQTVDGWELKALNPQRSPDGAITNISKDSIVLMAKKDGACAILMSDTEGSGSGAPDAGTAFGGTEAKIAALPGIEGCQILRVGA